MLRSAAGGAYWPLATNRCPSLRGVGGGGSSLFCDTGGGGGGEILEEAGTFSGQALLLSYPYPRGGGGPIKEAGTHSPPCPQYLFNIKPHAKHQIVKGSPLLAEDVYVTHRGVTGYWKGSFEAARQVSSRAVGLHAQGARAGRPARWRWRRTHSPPGSRGGRTHRTGSRAQGSTAGCWSAQRPRSRG